MVLNRLAACALAGLGCEPLFYFDQSATLLPLESVYSFNPFLKGEAEMMACRKSASSAAIIIQAQAKLNAGSGAR
jgi:hypothetical protein